MPRAVPHSDSDFHPLSPHTYLALPLRRAAAGSTWSTAGTASTPWARSAWQKLLQLLLFISGARLLHAELAARDLTPRRVWQAGRQAGLAALRAHYP